MIYTAGEQLHWSPNVVRPAGDARARHVLLHMDVWFRRPRGLCSAERDPRVRSRDRICLQEAVHGECDAGHVYRPLSRGCQASHNLDAAAGTAGRQDGPSRTACAD